MTSSARVHLFHWNAAEAGTFRQRIEAAGYRVTLHTAGGGLSVKAMSGTAVVVIDLSRLPSQGRAVASWLRGNRGTRQIPIVFVDGEPGKLARVKQDVPDAVYTSSKQIAQALKRAIKNAPSDPVIPPQMMASGRSTAGKLGIKEGSRVALIDAPSNVAKVLGTLPANVEVVEDGPGTVTLWFVLDPFEFERGLPARRKLAAVSRLWIIWKKGNPTGLNSNRVREAVLKLGLVDYKICSLDGVWSGIAVAGRDRGEPGRLRSGTRAQVRAAN
jgi:hypothetical protein